MFLEMQFYFLCGNKRRETAHVGIVILAIWIFK